MWRNAHLHDVATPETGSPQLEDAPCPCPTDKVLEREVDGLRVRFSSCKPGGFFQELLIKHKNGARGY